MIKDVLVKIKTDYSQDFQGLLEKYGLYEFHISDYWLEPMSLMYSKLNTAQRQELLELLPKINDRFLFDLEGLDNDFKKEYFLSCLHNVSLQRNLANPEFQKWTQSVSNTERINFILEEFDNLYESGKKENLKYLLEYLLSIDKEDTQDNRILNWALKRIEDLMAAREIFLLVLFVTGKHSLDSVELIEFILKNPDLSSNSDVKTGLISCMINSQRADDYGEWIIKEAENYNKLYYVTLRSNADDSINIGVAIYLRMAIDSWRNPENIEKLIRMFINSDFTSDPGGFSPLNTDFKNYKETIFEKSDHWMESKIVLSALKDYYIHNVEKNGKYGQDNSVIGELAVKKQYVEEFYAAITIQPWSDWQISIGLSSLFSEDLIKLILEDVNSNKLVFGRDALAYLFREVRFKHSELAHRFIELLVERSVIQDPRSEEQEIERLRKERIQSEIARMFDKDLTLEFIRNLFAQSESGTLNRDDLFSIRREDYQIHGFSQIPPVQLLINFSIGKGSSLIDPDRFFKEIDRFPWNYWLVQLIEQCYSREIEKDKTILTSEQYDVIFEFLFEEILNDRGNWGLNITSIQSQLLWNYMQKNDREVPKNVLLKLLDANIKVKTDTTEELWSNDQTGNSQIEALSNFLEEGEIRDWILSRLDDVLKSNAQLLQLRYIDYCRHFKLNEGLSFLRGLVKSDDSIVSGKAIEAIAKINPAILLEDYIGYGDSKIQWRILTELRHADIDGIEEILQKELVNDRFDDASKNYIAVFLVELGNVKGIEHFTKSIETSMTYDSLSNYHSFVSLEKSSRPEFLPYLIRLLRVSVDENFTERNDFHPFKSLVLSALMNLAQLGEMLIDIVVECELLIQENPDKYGFLEDWIKRQLENFRSNFVVTPSFDTVLSKTKYFIP